MKILLAEADGALAGRLFHLLVKNGYQTTAVKTGQAALVPVKKPMRKCKKNRAAGELEGARPASIPICGAGKDCCAVCLLKG